MFGRDYRIIPPENWIEAKDFIDEPERLNQGPERITVPNTENNINKDFFGIINLIHEAEDKKYQAELLIDGGCIIAASFHDKKTNDIEIRKAALNKIRKKFKGTKGKLKIKHLKPKEIKKTREKHKDKLLNEPVPFTDLDLKITLNPLKPKPLIPYLDKIASKYGLWAVRDPENPVQPTIYNPSKELAQEEAKEEEDIKSVLVDEALARQINGFVKQRNRRMDKFAGTPFESDVLQFLDRHRNMVEGGQKVETNMDLLYKLVQEYEALKLTELLADKLGIGHNHLIRWAHILERKGLAQVKYPIRGHPELRKIHKQGAYTRRVPHYTDNRI